MRLASALLLAATLGGTGAARAEEPITVKGSDTLVVLVQRWAEAFMAAYPQNEVQVTGGGSGTGIAALLNGTTDIATASRPITEEERRVLKRRTGDSVREWTVARDGVTFYVNQANPVDVLSLEQLRGLYRGDVTRWSQVGGAEHRVALYARENSSGTYAFVKEHLLKNDDFAIEAQTLPGTAAVVNAVSLEPWGVGFGGAAFAKGVKEVKVRLADGTVVTATDDSIRSGRYPFRRELFFYTRGQPRGGVRAFIEFALSPEGQRWVRQLGYYPIR